MSTQVHPAAVVEKGAELAEGVVVGPGAYVGPNVKVGKGTVIQANAWVGGHTELGEGNVIYPFASVGNNPQDLTYRGEPTRLTVGHRNQIREFTTLNTGTMKGGGLTSIGNENMFMAYSHVAHDCHVGSRCVMVNNSMLAGHVTLEDYVIVSGASAIYQFLRIGESGFITAGAMIGRDVPPFCVAAGHGGALYGLNVIGLRRRNFSSDTRTAIKRAYKIVFRSDLKLADAVAKLKSEFAAVKEVQQLAAFLEKTGKRGTLKDASRVRGRLAPGGGDAAGEE
ncbi:MAG TPA: acyl-ACP--UDP-N-acetylglucosamine O-acyltransferase [bacterium]|nr:acyl-ACP--UDP-N-acetylglucosamine O-acyltransferase [bacterium]